MDVKELEKTAEDLEKSVGTDDEEKAKEDNPSSLLGKALEVIKAFAPGKMGGGGMAGKMEEEEEGGHDHSPGETCGECGYGMKKSGETKQPHGEQNRLNTGDMGGRRRMKVYNYDAKMGTAEVDDYENAKGDEAYLTEKRNVHKSLDEIEGDPDLTDDDKVLVINDYLEKGFSDIAAVKASQEGVFTALGAIAKALKSVIDQGNVGRGRISSLSVMDKSLGGGGVNGSPSLENVNPKQLLRKALKAQSEGRINMNHVSYVENCLTDGRPIEQGLLDTIEGEQQLN